MTNEQKQKIIALRRDGAGYGRIAARLQISINTVKSFCRRHSLAANTAGAVCEQCGKPIEQNPGRKRKRKRLFQNETAFQVVMYLARRMLAEKFITGKEYRDFVQEMIRRYQPFSGDLYT